jgi:hypothetical protein
MYLAPRSTSPRRCGCWDLRSCLQRPPGHCGPPLGWSSGPGRGTPGWWWPGARTGPGVPLYRQRPSRYRSTRGSCCPLHTTRPAWGGGGEWSSHTVFKYSFHIECRAWRLCPLTCAAATCAHAMPLHVSHYEVHRWNPCECVQLGERGVTWPMTARWTRATLATIRITLLECMTIYPLSSLAGDTRCYDHPCRHQLHDIDSQRQNPPSSRFAVRRNLEAPGASGAPKHGAGLPTQDLNVLDATPFTQQHCFQIKIARQQELRLRCWLLGAGTHQGVAVGIGAAREVRCGPIWEREAPGVEAGAGGERQRAVAGAVRCWRTRRGGGGSCTAEKGWNVSCFVKLVTTAPI